MSESRIGAQKRDRPGTQSDGWRERVLALVRAQLIGLLVACLVLGASAVMIYTGILDHSNEKSVIVAACLAGGFVSGMLTGKKGKRSNVLLGLGAGGGLFLTLFVAGVVLCDAMPEVASLWLVGGSCFCGGGLSGFFGKPKAKARRR